MKKVIVKKNRYVDSVSLMGVSERVTAMQGIENAEAQMATCANYEETFFYMSENKPMFESYDEFLNECFR